jgi:Fe2+ transport system protein FeoA
MEFQLTLDGLKDGERAVIEGFDPALSRSWRLRFEDLGLLPETPVRRVARAPLGDPIAFEVRGTVLCIRRAEARLMRARPESRP